MKPFTWVLVIAFGVCIGSLVSNAISFVAFSAYTAYQAQLIADDIRQQGLEFNERLERQRQSFERQSRERRAKSRRGQTLARVCQDWTENASANPTSDVSRRNRDYHCNAYRKYVWGE